MRTLPRDFSLSLQNASTFEDVAQVPSTYQKTVPIEAGESWQPKSTVWPMGYSAGVVGIAEREALPCGVLMKAAGGQVLGAAYMYPSSPLLSLVPAIA